MLGNNAVVGPVPTSASTITVPQVLALLDGPLADVAAAIAAGEYALWLGSGISRDRVADVPTLVRQVLAHLSLHVGPTAPEYEAALTEAIGLAGLTPGQRAAIDITQPLAAWPHLDILVQRLGEKYSLLFDIRVTGKAPDYLLWDAGAVTNTFGSQRDPDVEHLCVAILAIEGVAPQIPSANWDGLIEAAFAELGADASVVGVCVRGADLRSSRSRARLIKFHGCAVLAASDPTAYRELLIVSQSQIANWPSSPTCAAIRAELEQLATTTKTLMIGLSAQDSNIQSIFGSARNRMQWTWPCAPPAHVFAKDQLGALQKSILKCAYGAGYDRDPIGAEAKAIIPAFAKPLLMSLVLHVLCAKAQTYASLLLNKFNQAERDEVALGIKALRDAAANGCDPTQTSAVRLLAASVTRTLTMLQEGKVPGDAAYRPLSALPIPSIASDPSRSTSGLQEAATALGLLGDGSAKGAWTMTLGDPSQANDGAVLVGSTGGRQSRVFFVANGTAEIALFRAGTVDEKSSDTVVVHSSVRAGRSPRSPKAAPGRTGRRKLRHVEMPTLVGGATTLDMLRMHFRQDACL